MAYKLTKSSDIPKKEKFGISLDVYPSIGDFGIVRVNTETGHNQEFYDKQSTFTYIILKGKGAFCLNDEEVKVGAGDVLSIPPETRIYYIGYSGSATCYSWMDAITPRYRSTGR
jgi:uncharacterized cupin superfamily protein